MNQTNVSTEENNKSGLYEIRLKGHLDARWADRFEDFSFAYDNDGTSILTGPVVDQAALHGLLRKVRDLGLPLVSVIQVHPRQASGPDFSTDSNHNHSKKERNT